MRVKEYLIFFFLLVVGHSIPGIIGRPFLQLLHPRVRPSAEGHWLHHLPESSRGQRWLDADVVYPKGGRVCWQWRQR